MVATRAVDCAYCFPSAVSVGFLNIERDIRENRSVCRSFKIEVYSRNR